MSGSLKAPRWTWSFYGLALLAFYLPLLGLVAGAFVERQNGQVFWSLRWFIEILSDQQLIPALANSLLVALLASFVSTCIGTLAAVGLHQSRGWQRRLIELQAYLTLFLPEIVLALSLLSWFFILQFQLGLVTVVIAHVTFTMAYVIFTVSAKMALFDGSLQDAAHDLGASPGQVLTTIILPWLKPAIRNGFLLSFLLSFDDFLITFFVNGVGNDTLPIKLYSSMKFGISPKLNALSVLMLVGTLGLAFLFFRNESIHALLKVGDKSRKRDQKNGSGEISATR